MLHARHQAALGIGKAGIVTRQADYLVVLGLGIGRSHVQVGALGQRVAGAGDVHFWVRLDIRCNVAHVGVIHRADQRQRRAGLVGQAGPVGVGAYVGQGAVVQFVLVAARHHLHLEVASVDHAAQVVNPAAVVAVGGGNIVAVTLFGRTDDGEIAHRVGGGSLHAGAVGGAGALLAEGVGGAEFDWSGFDRVFDDVEN